MHGGIERVALVGAKIRELELRGDELLPLVGGHLFGLVEF
jgi:hypothetical protein